MWREGAKVRRCGHRHTQLHMEREMLEREILGGRVSRRFVLRTGAVLAATAGAGVMAACGTSAAGGNTSGSAAAASKAPAEITYMTTWPADRLVVLNQGM